MRKAIKVGFLVVLLVGLGFGRCNAEEWILSSMELSHQNLFGERGDSRYLDASVQYENIDSKNDLNLDYFTYSGKVKTDWGNLFISLYNGKSDGVADRVTFDNPGARMSSGRQESILDVDLKGIMIGYEKQFRDVSMHIAYRHDELDNEEFSSVFSPAHGFSSWRKSSYESNGIEAGLKYKYNNLLFGVEYNYMKWQIEKDYYNLPLDSPKTKIYNAEDDSLPLNQIEAGVKWQIIEPLSAYASYKYLSLKGNDNDSGFYAGMEYRPFNFLAVTAEWLSYTPAVGVEIVFGKNFYLGGKYTAKSLQELDGILEGSQKFTIILGGRF
jgi:predicted porin